jgi:hypothetical protein
MTPLRIGNTLLIIATLLLLSTGFSIAGLVDLFYISFGLYLGGIGWRLRMNAGHPDKQDETRKIGKLIRVTGYGLFAIALAYTLFGFFSLSSDPSTRVYALLVLIPGFAIAAFGVPFVWVGGRLALWTAPELLATPPSLDAS